MIWMANGLSVAMPSRTAARDPAMLTTRVLPEMPARPRDTPGVDDARRQPRGAQRLGDAEQFAIQDVAGGLGGHVPRRDTGAADRDHQVDTADDRRVQRIADLDLVGGHHDDTVDDEARLTEQFGDQRPVVVLLAVRRPVVDDDDERPTHQLPWLFHECTVYLARDSRRGHAQRRRCPSAGHCAALPSVTCTVCGLPDGSR